MNTETWIRGILLLVLPILFMVPVIPAEAHNPHFFTADTAACGACHSGHAADGKNLLSTLATGNENEVYRNCMYCHKSGGQSQYDVYNGAIISTSEGGKVYASSGGGIANMVIVEGLNPQYSPVTSSHDVNKGTDDTAWTPGFDTGIAGNVFLTCSSCHSPHGGSSCINCHDVRNNTLSRLLKNQVNGVNVTPPKIGISNMGRDEATKIIGDINSFCAACHIDFNAQAAGSGDQKNGTYTQHTRHRVGMDPSGYIGSSSVWNSEHISQPSTVLPLQNNGTAQVSCLTCHFAHGTYRSSSVVFNRVNSTTSNSSTLLRLDNRGVCQACHNK